MPVRTDSVRLNKKVQQRILELCGCIDTPRTNKYGRECARDIAYLIKSDYMRKGVK